MIVCCTLPSQDLEPPFVHYYYYFVTGLKKLRISWGGEVSWMERMRAVGKGSKR